MNDRAHGRGWRDDRVWQAGFLVGSALGAVATVVGRRAERSARQGLVDWPAAEKIAVARLKQAPGALSPDELQATEASYAEAMSKIVPRLSARGGRPATCPTRDRSAYSTQVSAV